MRDLSDYIVKMEGEFYVDVYDVESGEALWEDGEVFTFSFEDKVYKGCAFDKDGYEMVKVTLK